MQGARLVNIDLLDVDAEALQHLEESLAIAREAAESPELLKEATALIRDWLTQRKLLEA